MSVSRKIWGIKHRLFQNEKIEFDLLYLEKDSACSVHNHKNKINRFILINGSVTVKTDLGLKKLVINEAFDVEPPLKHQFIIHDDSVLLEMAFVKTGKIEESDIVRVLQGGKFIKGKFLTLDELKKDKWGEL